MANLFKNQKNAHLTPRQLYESRYRSSRYNLILVIAFTLVNMVLCLTNANTYFLFSASIPYLLTDLGMFLCGKYPEEFYLQDEFNGMELLDTSFLAVMVVIAVVILALYFVCWLLSKKKVGWLIAALVLFGIDTVAMFWYFGITKDMIIDIIFHAWVICYLAMGIHSHFKLKNLPEETFAAETETYTEKAESEVTDTNSEV